MMANPGKDNAPPAGETGRGAKNSEAGNLKRERTTSSSNEPHKAKAAVFQLPGARRRQIPRCDGCGNPISTGSALCETCASGAALVARIEDRRAASLRRQSLGQRARAGG